MGAPLILRLTTKWRRLRSAALLSEGTSGWATKTKSSLMWRLIRRHSLADVADGSSKKGRQRTSSRCSRDSCATAHCFSRGSSEGFGLTVEAVDRVSPPGQWFVIGVEGSQVVDVPQQVDPAALFGAVVMVVGGIAVADQAAHGVAQHLVHHRFAPVTPQEVALGRRAEGTHVAVVAILTPARFIGALPQLKCYRNIGWQPRGWRSERVCDKSS